jgi:hypothetical protein
MHLWVLFSTMTWCMDDPTPKALINSILSGGASTGADDPNAKISDKALLDDIIAAGSGIVSVGVDIGAEMIEMGGDKPITRPGVPKIDLGGNARGRGSMGVSPTKKPQTPVDNVSALKGCMQTIETTKRTARAAENTKRTGPHLLTGDVQQRPHPMLPAQQRKSVLPTGLLKSIADKGLIDDDSKTYTEDEVWKIIEKCNPVLHSFGQKYKLAIDELDLFAEYINNLDINPGVIIEHNNVGGNRKISFAQRVASYFGGDVAEQRLNRLHEQYEQMKKEHPENYKEMALEILKSLQEGHETNPSTIANVHNDLQSQQIDDQAAQIRLQYAGMLTSVLLAVLGATGTITQLIYNPTNSNSTNAHH